MQVQDLCCGVRQCVHFVRDNHVLLQFATNSLSLNLALMLTLTLLFTDSFQPISFSSHCNGVCMCMCASVWCWHCYFSAAKDISECRTHDTSHASISSINIYNISDPFSTECTHSKKTKPKKDVEKARRWRCLLGLLWLW